MLCMISDLSGLNNQKHKQIIEQIQNQEPHLVLIIPDPRTCHLHVGAVLRGRTRTQVTQAHDRVMHHRDACSRGTTHHQAMQQTSDGVRLVSVLAGQHHSVAVRELNVLDVLDGQRTTERQQCQAQQGCERSDSSAES